MIIFVYAGIIGLVVGWTAVKRPREFALAVSLLVAGLASWSLLAEIGRALAKCIMVTGEWSASCTTEILTFFSAIIFGLIMIPVGRGVANVSDRFTHGDK